MDTRRTKRQRENKEDEQQKRQRSLSPDDDPMQTTKITSLNDDCLVKIFNLLGLKDLFNVAIANEWLRPAARDVYKRKFGAKEVFIDGIRRPAPEESHSIKIRGLKMSLQYLRCFGSSIKELTFDYRGFNCKRNQYVHHYINEYCVESLIKIAFIRKLNNPIEHFVKPFNNVMNVKVSDSNLGQQLPSFVEWFPNLQSLELYNTNLDDGFTNARFHHLEKLKYGENCENRSTIKDVTTLLSSNRQLRDVTIHMGYDGISAMSTLSDMIKNNPLISKLDTLAPESVEYRAYSTAMEKLDPLELQRLIKEHPSMVSLSLPRCYQFTTAEAIKLIPQLEPLELIEVFYNGSWVDKQKAPLQTDGWYYNYNGLRGPRRGCRYLWVQPRITLYRKN